MRAERRSRRGASQVTRSANSQLLEYIANGVRQRPPDPGTIGHGPVGVSCSDDGWLWRDKRPKVGNLRMWRQSRRLMNLSGEHIVSFMTSSPAMTLRRVVHRVGLVNALSSC